MAKRLLTRVVLIDEEGNSHDFGPDDKLPSWAVRQLNKNWGKRPDLWDEDGSEEAVSEESPAEGGGKAK